MLSTVGYIRGGGGIQDSVEEIFYFKVLFDISIITVVVINLCCTLTVCSPCMCIPWSLADLLNMNNARKARQATSVQQPFLVIDLMVRTAETIQNPNFCLVDYIHLIDINKTAIKLALS